MIAGFFYVLKIKTMEKVIDKLNNLLDPFSWEITISSNEDESPFYKIYVDGDVLTYGYNEDDLLDKLNDEKTLLGIK